MKLPEKSPNRLFIDISSNDIGKLNEKVKQEAKIFPFFISPVGQALAKKANKEYHYWDKVKYYDLPDGITQEIAWFAVKLSRSLSRTIPLKDKNGNQFRFWFPDVVLKELSFIDKHNGDKMFSDKIDLPGKQKEKYLINSLMEEAIASSQLEGAATTREKAKEMLRRGEEPKNIDEKMILNNYKTIMSLKTSAKGPLTAEIIKQIQSMLTEDTLRNKDDVGRFRSPGDDIQVLDRLDGELLFVPPKAEEVESRIKELCDYVNSAQEDEFTHPVIKAILIHFWLAYIHPFCDGNGRTARALFYWFLLKSGYWKFEFISISRTIKESPGQYSKAYLYTEMDDCDLTYFLVFNLNRIHRAIDEFEDYVENKQKELTRTVGSLKNFTDLNHRQYDLLRHAVLHPEAMYTVRAHQKIHNIVYQTARTDLLYLVKKGFIVKRRIGKEFNFFPSDDIASKVKLDKPPVGELE